jgi:membrane-associated protein
MDAVKHLTDFVMHADKYIDQVVSNYGIWANGFIFMIIFIETGLVVMPFLPGDSLIFVVGALAASGTFNIILSLILLVTAAVVGDAVNYFIGHKMGRKAFNNRFLKQEHLQQAEDFYEKHGGKAIVLGRFVPIVRTFVPFVAGIGKMSYPEFFKYNLFGGALWVSTFLFAGYFFGNLNVVKEKFSLVVMAIIILSVAPAIYHFAKENRKTKKA